MAEEKTETYLLTNKGMEKLDVKKDLHRDSPSPGDAQSRKPQQRREGASGRQEGNTVNNSALKKAGIDQGMREKRTSYKSYNQSVGESGMDVS